MNLKTCYKAEKKRILEKLAFLKFKKQLLKIDSSLNSFKERYL